MIAVMHGAEFPQPMAKRIKKFILPSFTRGYIIRLCLVAVGTYLLLGHILTPVRIQGSSMEPTYRDGSLNLCWRLAFFMSRPRRGDVVMIRLAGRKLVLLKRIVAFEGEAVEFRAGKLFVDGHMLDEPYVQYPCSWNLPPRIVRDKRIYVVGDNRSMPIENHLFGETEMDRVIGAPLW